MFSLMLCTHENINVFIAVKEDFCDIHCKRINVSYTIFLQLLDRNFSSKTIPKI